MQDLGYMDFCLDYFMTYLSLKSYLIYEERNPMNPIKSGRKTAYGYKWERA
jgi:hypothetical protein